MKKSAVICFALLAVFLFFASNASAGWYTCVVYKVITYSGGDTNVQLDPGTGETSFVDTARGRINGGALGANRMLATILTAYAQGAEVRVLMNDIPGWDPVQEIKAIGIINE